MKASSFCSRKAKTGTALAHSGISLAWDFVFLRTSAHHLFRFFCRVFLVNCRFDQSHNRFTLEDVVGSGLWLGFRLLEMLWREDRFAARSSLQKAIALDPYYTQALELLMDLDIQA